MSKKYIVKEYTEFVYTFFVDADSPDEATETVQSSALSEAIDNNFVCVNNYEVEECENREEEVVR